MRSKPLSAAPAGPSRRAALLLAAFLAAGAATGLWYGFSEPKRPADSRQNVLLITIDTLRSDMLGSYGGAAKTPVLDRLAAEGLRFSFAHTHAVVTLPAHTSLLTGLTPIGHGVHDNAGFRVQEGQATLATRLRERGFATGAFVSSATLDARYGLNRGFDVYREGYPEEAAPDLSEVSQRIGEDTVADALSWLKEQQGRQWFCWVHLFDPHAPYEPPPRFRRGSTLSDLYRGEVEYTDESLGPLIELARGAEPGTLIIVTADHGESLGDHGEDTHGIFGYESTLHVPLIVHQPRLLPRPLVIDDPVSHIDVVPTVLELLGMERPSELPGRSLLDPIPGREHYFQALSSMLTRGWAPLRGLLVGREKYISLPLPELYDLQADPKEKENLIGARPASETARRRRTLQALLQAGEAIEREEVDPEMAAALESLGYVASSADLKEEYTVEDDPKRLLHLHDAMQRASGYRMEGRLDEAIAVYRKILAERPDFAAAYTHLSNTYERSGQIGHALETLREAEQAGALNQSARSYLVTYLVQAGRAEEALELLGTCSELKKGGHVDSLNALGIALGSLHRDEEAKVCFEAMLEVDPDNPMALTNVGILELQAEETEQAEKTLRHAVELDETQLKAWNALGVIAARRRDLDRAIESWKHVVRLDARQFDTLYNLGVLLSERRPSEAKLYLEAFLRTAPVEQYRDDLVKVRGIIASLEGSGEQ